MDRKFKWVASAVIIVIVLGIGTGLITVPVFKLPETNYLALGMTLLNQNGGTTQSIIDLDSKTIAKIEN
ncbi:MAG: hypothetical protein ACUVXA_06465 [Candidatus Jordarchaeum sp.]|uniref:hypothetical protein n=1 Tax=Candidatus Jordarchaeum sp. TaxID=2823881 RepID=UPI00404B02B6